jgi:hypothetical protein
LKSAATPRAGRWRWGLPLTLLIGLLLCIGGCRTIPEIGGPVVAANTPGAGQLQLPSGETYWVMPTQLMFSGNAKFLWPDGRWYQGQWATGQPQGKGELQLPSGEHYIGDFQHGNRHGSGIQISNTGKYQGAWLQDAAHGQGQFTASNGDNYQGAYQQGQRQGYGELQAADGSEYRGDWQQDQPHGQGDLTMHDGQLYSGGWVAGQRNGYGDLKDKLGNHYAGTWVAGERQGFGQLSRSDRSRYEGEWLHDLRHGTGIETFATGGQHNGEWSHNKALGAGTRQTRIGIKILGFFTGDRVSNGLLELPSGAEYAGPLFRQQMTQVAAPLLTWTQAQAEAGDPAAQWLLAGFYQRFAKPAANQLQAVRWYQAAAATIPDAQFRAGQLLLDDKPGAAVAYLQQAATQNHVQAQQLLGELYHSGRAVSPNATTAMDWYARAAEQGSLEAKTQLAWLLSTSQEAHARNPQRALALIEVTAKTLKTWALLDTLAATYAALENFPDAVHTQQAAIAALNKNSMPQLAPLQARLALYRTGKPYIEVVYAGD